MSRKSSSGLFLMEMIMVVGFFLMCAGVCISVFVKADTMSRLARDTNQAVLLAQSTVEVLKAKGVSEAEQMAAERDGDSYILYWDKEGNKASEKGEAEYEGRITIEEDGLMDIAEVGIYPASDNSPEKELYHLTSEIYGREKS